MSDELPTMEEALSNVGDWGPRSISPVSNTVADEVFDGAARGRGRPPKPRRRPESEIVLEAISYIRSLPGGYAHKVHGGPMGNTGEPDLDACVRGRACKLEAKAGSGKPTPTQVAAMKRWEKSGALVGWFRNLEQLKQLLDHLGQLDYRTDLTSPGCSQPCHKEVA